MKVLSIAAALIVVSSTAFAEVEVVCDAHAGTRNFAADSAQGDAINVRVKELQSKGKKVTITQLTSSASITASDAVHMEQISNVCAALSY